MFPESETAPFEVFTLVTADTDIVFPSGSASLVKAVMVTALFVFVEALSGLAKGARLRIVAQTPGTT